MNLKNKSVLVIGGTGGIGSELVKRLSEEGADVSVFSRNEEKLSALREQFPDAFFYKGDAKSGTDLEEFASRAFEKFGAIDSVIHSVGSIVLKPLQLLDEKMFRDTLELNLVSPFLTAKAVLPFMQKARQGSMVFISSVAGSKGLVNHEAISAAKGGLEAFIRSSAVTYAKKGIRFNGVALGLVETPMAEFLTKNPMALKASTSVHPMGRIGKPEDVTEAILYLVSDSSSWVTGTILPIDGGMAAN